MPKRSASISDLGAVGGSHFYAPVTEIETFHGAIRKAPQFFPAPDQKVVLVLCCEEAWPSTARGGLVVEPPERTEDAQSNHRCNGASRLTLTA